MTCVPELVHFIPLSHLAEELISRGHTVHMITLDYGIDRIEKLCKDIGITLISLCQGMPFDNFRPHANPKV